MYTATIITTVEHILIHVYKYDTVEKNTTATVQCLDCIVLCNQIMWTLHMKVKLWTYN